MINTTISVNISVGRMIGRERETDQRATKEQVEHMEALWGYSQIFYYKFKVKLTYIYTNKDTVYTK